MRRIAIILAILIIVGLGLFWATRPKPLPVIVKEVTPGLVEATLANTRAGTVEACQRTKLSTIIGGRIEYLGVKEGDRVKKGQLLLKLWNDDQQAQTALAQAQITPEQLGDAQARITSAVDALVRPHAGQQIAMVAHGGVLDVLYRAATRLDLQAPRTWEYATAPSTACCGRPTAA